jgi:hypothetical protein
VGVIWHDKLAKNQAIMHHCALHTGQRFEDFESGFGLGRAFYIRYILNFLQFFLCKLFQDISPFLVFNFLFISKLIIEVSNLSYL